MSGLRWLPAAIWLAIVFTLTSIPNPRLPSLTGGDKAAHTIMYGVLGVLVAYALAGGRRSLARFVAAFVAIAAIAAVDEWHQRYVPGRSASTADWWADVVGAGLSLLASGAIVWRRESR